MTTMVMMMNAMTMRRLAARAASSTHMRRALSTAAADTAAATAPKTTGPPFKKFFWITTGIMFGIPGVLGAAFVYNLQNDDEFYEHFEDKYPDLIEAINEYVPLREEEKALANRTDIGDVSRGASELLSETMTVVAELQSRKKVRFQVLGSASQQEIEALALQHSGVPNDRVIAISFDEDGETTSDAQTSAVQVEENATPNAITTKNSWPPQQPRVWGSGKRAAPTATDLRTELQQLRLKQAQLEESKYAGRDIDEVDEEIAGIEAQKTAIKERLPRKRFLWIF